MMREWADSFDGKLRFRPPDAGAITLMRYDADVPSIDIAECVRTRQSVLIVPGSHLGLEGFLRIWMGGRSDYLREGLKRVEAELRPILDPA
jgi:hypothetical protein